MPELPEVETIRCHLEPEIKGLIIRDIFIREKRLRWPIVKNFPEKIRNQIIKSVHRRGKYLLLDIDKGTIIIHLGMSGSLQIVPKDYPIKKHDHVGIVFDNKCLRFNDPRRFGAIMWTNNASQHRLLRNLGHEPLTDNFSDEYLYKRSRNRKIAVKQFIMDNHIVTGIGNIYANEALFAANIDPRLQAGKISKQRYNILVKHIKRILKLAIKNNGTTFRDFISSNGQPGSFKMQLKAYGRGGLPCVKCGNILREIRLGQRSTVYCPCCLKKFNKVVGNLKIC
jgi:formamidopyrimidine-DNA glycosylase